MENNLLKSMTKLKILLVLFILLTLFPKTAFASPILSTNIQTDDQVAIGTTSANAKFDIFSAIEHLRRGYNDNNYTSIIASSAAGLVINLGNFPIFTFLGNSVSPSFMSGLNIIAGDDKKGTAIMSGGHSLNGSTGNNYINQQEYSVILGGEGNSIPGSGYNFGFIGGGAYNKIDKSIWSVAIAGGKNNLISHTTGFGSLQDFIGGGENNYINSHNNGSNVIGGGYGNSEGWNGSDTLIGGKNNNAYHYAFLGGGENNISGANGNNATVVFGGYNNGATGYGATIIGGKDNTASAQYSFSSGRQAKAAHTGSRIWADSSAFNFNSSANKELAFRSTGGIRFVTVIDGNGNPTKTVSLASNGNLTVNGGVRLNTTATKPTCSFSYRGYLWFTQGATDTKDALEVCSKDASDAYAWALLY